MRLYLMDHIGAQTSIVQNLTYFEHLSEPMAEFLQILFEQYDYPQLVDEILRELSNKEFNSNDTKGPKSVSTFIITLSEKLPRLVMKQMTLVVKLLESEVSFVGSHGHGWLKLTLCDSPTTCGMPSSRSAVT